MRLIYVSTDVEEGAVAANERQRAAARARSANKALAGVISSPLFHANCLFVSPSPFLSFIERHI